MRICVLIGCVLSCNVTPSLPALEGTSNSYLFLSEADEKRIATFGREIDSGKLHLLHHTSTEGEPGPLTVDLERNLLVASMRSTGALASFRLDPVTGKLTPLSLVPAGADPAYVKIDRTGKWLLAAYYQAGKVTVHQLSDDGVISPKAHQTIPTDVKAHAIELDATNRFAFVPHTGPNAIYQFQFDDSAGNLRAATPKLLQLEKNTGPRHIVFHPTLPIVYADNEQGSSVTVYAFDRKSGTLSPRKTLSTLPEGFTKPNSCAHLELTPNGKFLFVANRGHESLAGYAVDPETGLLSSIGNFDTEPTPRSFNISSDGKYLYAAGQSSDRLACFRIGPDGRLNRFSTVNTGKRPWWVLVVDLN